MPDTAPPTAAKTKYTSAEARALYLEQLKKTDPSPAVRKIIRDLEQPTSGRRRRRRRHTNNQAIA